MYIVDLSQPPQGFCGCRPRPMKVGANPLFKIWGTVDDTPIIPRTDWITTSLRHLVWEICNQSNQNSCCPTATRGAVQIIREMTGLKRIRLSQGSLYYQISGGRDQGANIMDALEAMMAVGMCPDSVIDEYDWRGRDYPSNWKAEAAKFRIPEAFDCPSFDEMISAIQKSFPVVFGVNWEGGGGHAIVGVGYDKATNRVEILNSWDKTWGDGGFGFLSESDCRAITGYGAFAIRSVTLPSEEDLPPSPK